MNTPPTSVSILTPHPPLPPLFPLVATTPTAHSAICDDGKMQLVSAMVLGNAACLKDAVAEVRAGESAGAYSAANALDDAGQGARERLERYDVQHGAAGVCMRVCLCVSGSARFPCIRV